MEESITEGISTSGSFSEIFRNEISALQNQIDHLGDVATAGDERSYALDHCTARIARLSQEVQNVAATLPAYDHKTCVEAIRALTDRLSKTRAVVAPRPRFQFKSRLTEPGTTRKANTIPGTNTSSQSSSNNVFGADVVSRDFHKYQQQNNDEEDVPAHEDAEQQKSLLRVSDLSNEKIFRSTLATDSNTSLPDQAELLRIRQSVVIWRPGEDIKGISTLSASTKDHGSHSKAESDNFSHSTNIDSNTKTTTAIAASSFPILKILRLRNIHRSLIIIAHSIAGAVYVSDVHDSILVLAGCQQLRMHGCKDVRVYVESTTGPVMEGCVGIGFARWPVALSTMNSIADTNNNNNKNANIWDHYVVDFSNPGAINSSPPHPQSTASASSSSSSRSNWYIMQPDECLTDETWRRVIAAAEGKIDDDQLSAEEILTLCRR